MNAHRRADDSVPSNANIRAQGELLRQTANGRHRAVLDIRAEHIAGKLVSLHPPCFKVDARRRI